MNLILCAASLGSAYVLGRKATLLSSIYKYPLLGIIGLAVAAVFCKIFSFNKQMKVEEAINSFLGQYREYATLALDVNDLGDLDRIAPDPMSPIVYGKTNDYSHRFLILRVKEKSDPDVEAQIWRCLEQSIGSYIIEKNDNDSRDLPNFGEIENLLAGIHSEFALDISPAVTF